MPFDTQRLGPFLEQVANLTNVSLEGLKDDERAEIMSRASKVLAQYSDLLESLRDAWQAPTNSQFSLQAKAREEIESELTSEGLDRIEYPDSPTEAPDPTDPENYAILREDDDGKLYLRVKRTLETPTRQSLLEFTHELFALSLINQFGNKNDSLEKRKHDSMQIGPISVSHVLDLVVQNYIKQSK